MRPPPPPRAAFVQTGTKDTVQSARAAAKETARASALSSREKALSKRAKALAARERALEQKAATVRAEELKEEQEQAALDTRAQALEKKEKQVNTLESELVRQQKVVWKVLRSRQAAPKAAPQPVQLAELPTHASLVPHHALLHRQEHPPARIEVATKHHSTGPKKHAPLALAQMSTNSKVKRTQSKVHAKAKVARRAVAATDAQVAAKGVAVAGSRSDLHVVMAAQVPQEGSFHDVDDEDAKDDDDADSKGTDEDSKGTNNKAAATADNDDLEELASSSETQTSGDAVESF